MALLKKGPKGGLASNTLRLERELRVRLRRAELPFLAAVRGFPWEQIRGKRDERMLLEGLWMLGRENETKEPLLAIRAFERILLLAANGARARKVRAGHLTTAYAAAGRLEEARKRIEALALASRGEEQRLLWVEAADLWTAMGKAKEARKALRIASEKRLLPKAKKGLAGKKAQVDRVAEDFETASERVRRLVQARLRIQAKQKLGIESDDWIGSYPHASPKGQPVLFVFLATWSEASLRTLRYLASKLEKERAEGRSVGFDIVGVLVRGTRGALPPKDGGPFLLPSAPLEGTRFDAHVTEYRERLGLRIPFVIVSKATLSRFEIVTLPSVVLVDGNGRALFYRSSASGALGWHAAMAASRR